MHGAYLNDTWQVRLNNGKRNLTPIRTVQKKTKSHEPTARAQHDDGAIPKPDRNSANGCQDTVNTEKSMTYTRSAMRAVVDVKAR
jgi:hypothetical protein